jgi:hypothetical protein
MKFSIRTFRLSRAILNTLNNSLETNNNENGGKYTYKKILACKASAFCTQTKGS